MCFLDRLSSWKNYARRLQAATEAREAALVSKHAAELSHAVGRQREELRQVVSND